VHLANQGCVATFANNAKNFFSNQRLARPKLQNFNMKGMSLQSVHQKRSFFPTQCRKILPGQLKLAKFRFGLFVIRRAKFCTPIDMRTSRRMATMVHLIQKQGPGFERPARAMKFSPLWTK